jgi:dynein light intermediate chain
VAVDCPERGLLLMRVRDEQRMTLTAYQTIYQSSVAFGMKKKVEADEGYDDL